MRKKNYYQTIIVGAGPGGLSAAKFLKDFLILEKKEEIGKPVQCGEGLADYFFKIMELEENAPWVSIKAQKTEIILPSKKKIFIPDTIYVIDRVGFEKDLAKNILPHLKTKAEVVNIERENEEWKITTKEKEVFYCQYLMGADGPASIVRRKVFKKSLDLFPCLEYFMETEKELTLESVKIFLDLERFKYGYAWIFPKSKNTANIGLGGKFELKKEFEKFLENEVKEICGKVKFLSNKSGVIPIGGQTISLFKNNAFLVGDAAGLADPLTGGGIGNAMISGRLAAKLILENRVQEYDKTIKNLPFFLPSLLKASSIFYSMNNEIIEQLADFLERKKLNFFKLENLQHLFSLFKIESFRKNWKKMLELFFIYKDYAKRKSNFSG
ncbi:MAG: NAD(P)/FAD-dependent oxidoreductase [Minisyncoccales bacterium]